MPMRSAYRLSSGIMRKRAIILGSTRNSMGEMPRVFRASISSFTCIVPSWAANDAPDERDDRKRLRAALLHREKEV